MDFESITSIGELLAWLIGPGAMIVVAWFVSWALEGTAVWEKASSGLKKFLMLVASGAISFGASELMRLPEETLSRFDFIAVLIVMFAGTWVTTQVAHAKNPFRDKYIVYVEEEEKLPQVE